MGKFFSPEMKSGIHLRLLQVNDRSFAFITVFAISTSVTMLDDYFNNTTDMSILYYAFIALSFLVITTLLSSCGKFGELFRVSSATLCVFLWLFVAKLSDVFSSNFLYSSIFTAMLFWSNVNLLGVFLNARE